MSRRHVRWGVLRSPCPQAELPTADIIGLQLSQGLHWYLTFLPQPQLDLAPAYPTCLISPPSVVTAPNANHSSFSGSHPFPLSWPIPFSIRSPHKCCDLPNHLPTGTLYLPPPVAETGFSADDTTSPPTALPSEVCPFPHTPDTPGSRRGSAFYPTPPPIISSPSAKTPAVLTPNNPITPPQHS